MPELSVTLEEAKIMIWSLTQSVDDLQQKNRRLDNALREIISDPRVREVLAPRGSLGSLLDMADAALNE